MQERKSLPLLPGCLARDAVEELRAYVRSYLYARQADTAEAIEKNLFIDEPIFKGPFVDLSMPFRVAPAADWPLNPKLKWDFDPYFHQMEAFKRLQYRNSRNTLVTTGTGSGKSECFIMPILDYVLHCKEIGKGEKGVKALIMYPMNALIADQGERLCRLANSLGCGIRVGKYTGNSGFRAEHDPNRPEEIIDDRESLCENPPDILLTNYRMLDLMLFRPEEQAFWGKATREVFKYLVLDEVHTFDGAQGADVAGLIRRFRLKLRLDFTCVGTSATIAAGSADKPKDIAKGQEMLVEFAATLFGAKFEPEDIIVEPRVNASEFFSPDQALGVPSGEPKKFGGLLVSGRQGSYENYIKSLCELWQADTDPVKRGEWIKRHPLAKAIYEKHRGVPIPELAKECGIEEETLYQFLDLLASARKPLGKKLGPLLKLEVQLWVTSVPYMIRKLTPDPIFRSNFARDELLRDYLPAVNCRSCGLSGWVAKLDESNKSIDYLPLTHEFSAHVQSLFTEDGWVIFPGRSKSAAGVSYVFDSESQALINDKSEEAQGRNDFFLTALPIDLDREIGKTIHRNKKLKTTDQSRCPGCEEPLSLSLTSLGSSILGSILTGLYLAHGANPSDKKYLIFNDSVQDASHQAGYISARSFRFNLRRIMWLVARQQFQRSQDQKTFAWNDLLLGLEAEIRKLWESGINGNKTATRQLAQNIPQDLWEYWEKQKMGIALRSPDGLKNLLCRLKWEFWMENTVSQDLGWSLRKAQLMRIRPTADCYKSLVESLHSLADKHNLKFTMPLPSFLLGLIDHCLRLGIAYHPDLEKCYSRDKFSLWPIYHEFPELAVIFSSKGRHPRILSLNPPPGIMNKSEERYVQYLIPRASQGNRLTKWVQRHIDDKDFKTAKVIPFLMEFMKANANERSVFRLVGQPNSHTIVLNLENFQVTSEPSKIYRCRTCGAMRHMEVNHEGDRIPCAVYSCVGDSFPLKGKDLTDTANFGSYLAKLIDREVLAPFVHSHTGQLDREQREAVEKAFKKDLVPGDLIDEKKGLYFKNRPINVLTCTPTMEMGIDIGSLSGVMLRGFPRSLSNIKQRLGRSGRESGNSLNFIVAGRSSHDRQYWQSPNLLFKGQIKPPGCDFRTRGFLERHFNAYIFDLFSLKTKGVSFPKGIDLGESGLFLTHPVWIAFKEFLHNFDPHSIIDSFMTSVRLMDQSPNEKFYSELRSYLETALRERKLDQAVEKVLRKQDSELTAARASTKFAEKKDQDHANNPDSGSQTNEAALLTKRRERLSTSDFIFGVLAGEGILPNYAFPEAGVSLDATIQFPQSRDRERSKPASISNTRPPLQALRELVPRKHYYVPGFKIPITRVIPPANFSAKDFRHVFCDSCGAVSSADKDLTGLKSSCPKCLAENQDVASLVPFSAVIGHGHFNRLQIRDDEETRERGSDQVSIMIDYNSSQIASGGDYACWEDNRLAIIIEFRTAATIHAVARGSTTKHQSHYYNLCPQCLAVPCYYDKDGIPQFTDATGINRHSPECNYQSPAKTKKSSETIFALGHRFISDAIRFHVNDVALLPTAKASLMLMMRLTLKGNPGHIHTLVSFLQDGKILILTLYDSVPGGSGHLRSFMQFDGQEMSRDTSGLRLLQNRFLQVKKHIQSCACENGCYECLYTYDNQFEHDKIRKKSAIQWLQRYIDAVWSLSSRPLNEQMVHNPNFDNPLEMSFFEALAKPKFMDSINRSRVEKAGSHGQCIHLQLHDGRKVIIEQTTEREIPLNSFISYTKPDFTIVEASSSKSLGFIYTDGAYPHLASTLGIKSNFLKTDIFTRPQLELEYVPRESNRLSRVATYSREMVLNWKRHLENSDDSNRGENIGISEYNGRKFSSLICLLMSIFVNRDEKTPWKEYLVRTHQDFVKNSLSQIINLTESQFVSAKDLKIFFSGMATQSRQLQTFGALSFSPEDKTLIFDAAQMQVEEDRLPPELIASWEIYWILWQIDPQLIKIKTTVDKNDHYEITIEGYDDLDSQHQKDIVAALTTLGIGPDDLRADRHDLASIVVPFASLTKSYVVIDAKDLETEQELPEVLDDGCILAVVDFQRETASQAAKRIFKRLKGSI